jgi:hypothetical protein
VREEENRARPVRAFPSVLTDLATINRDLYYGIYAFSAFAFLAYWLRFAVTTAAGKEGSTSSPRENRKEGP